MINTIIFDLAEVYLNGVVGIEKYLNPVIGITDFSQVHEALWGDKFREYMHGKITENEYWAYVINKNNWPIEVNDLKEMVRKNMQEIPGTREIIEELKENDYKLGLLSVHSRELIEYCNNKFDHHKLFDAVSYSFETGVSKPDKKAYEIILNKLNSKPQESLFIDDSRRNVDAAKSIGMQAIQFQDAQQLRKELKQIGIRI